jgi:hypothetical protein
MITQYGYSTYRARGVAAIVVAAFLASPPPRPQTAAEKRKERIRPQRDQTGCNGRSTAGSDLRNSGAARLGDVRRPEVIRIPHAIQYAMREPKLEIGTMLEVAPCVHEEISKLQADYIKHRRERVAVGCEACPRSICRECDAQAYPDKSRPRASHLVLGELRLHIDAEDRLRAWSVNRVSRCDPDVTQYDDAGSPRRQL